MNIPIIEGLKDYLKENNIRFHMPGHKGKESLIEWNKLIPQIDVTEVSGTDNLHQPETIILESQRLASKTFGSKETFYSINGTTGGIYAAIASVTKPNDKVLVQRNCHKSVYNALIFNNLEAEYVHPVYDKENNIVTGVLVKDIEKKLKKNPDIKSVIITNPSYYGICSNIKEIADITHKYNMILIVDEAHGSHFQFSKKLPLTAIKAGADIVIQSTHKTLPAFTQSSMVHVNSSRVDIKKLKKMMTMYQTTSPSYILMASLDIARGYMEDIGSGKLDKLIDYIENKVEYLNNIQGVKVFDQHYINKSNIFDFDITKLLISVDGLNGKELEKILRRDYNIQLEMSDYFYGLALCTVLDDKEDIDKLVNAIKDISLNKKVKKSTINNFNINIKHIEPKKEMTLHSAFYKDKKEIELSKSKGQVSGGFIIPYPPGIPIICPGEIITSEIIEYIQFLKKNDIQLLGFLDENKEKIEIVR